MYGEHLAAECHYHHLPYQDNECHKQEVTRMPYVMECTPATHERFGVEHVPELHEHEYGEEYRQFVTAQFSVRRKPECGPEHVGKAETGHGCNVGTAEVLHEHE